MTPTTLFRGSVIVGLCAVAGAAAAWWIDNAVLLAINLFLATEQDK